MCVGWLLCCQEDIRNCHDPDCLTLPLFFRMLTLLHPTHTPYHHHPPHLHPLNTTTPHSKTISMRLSHKIFNLTKFSQPTENIFYVRVQKEASSILPARSYVWRTTIMRSMHTSSIVCASRESWWKVYRGNIFSFYFVRPRFMGKTECVAFGHTEECEKNTAKDNVGGGKTDVDDNNGEEMRWWRRRRRRRFASESHNRQSKGIGLKVFPHTPNFSSLLSTSHRISNIFRTSLFSSRLFFFNKENAASERKAKHWRERARERSRRGEGKKSFIHNWHHDRRVENILEEELELGHQCQSQCRRIQST